MKICHSFNLNFVLFVSQNFFSFPRWFAPSVDNVLLKKLPEDLLKEGQVVKVPVLTGVSRHEGAFYYPCKKKADLSYTKIYSAQPDRIKVPQNFFRAKNK